MKQYYPYDPASATRISERKMVDDGHILLTHIPKQGSIVIAGFVESLSVNLEANAFRCDYSLHTYYREANRLLFFNPVNDGRILDISYIAVGSPVTADDMNEIKAHLESPHNTGVSWQPWEVGEGLQLENNVISSTISGGYSSWRGTDYSPPADKHWGDFFNAASADFPDNPPEEQDNIRLWDGENWRHIGENWQVPVYFGPYVSGDSSRFQGDIWEDDGQLLLHGSEGRIWRIDTPENSSSEIKLGKGLEFDASGAICISSRLSDQNWEYRDSGYTIVPPPPLVYVDDEWFYQPNEDARFNDMFDTPSGIMEVWIRCDVSVAGALSGDDRFHIGFQKPSSGSQYTNFGNGRSAYGDSVVDIGYRSRPGFNGSHGATWDYYYKLYSLTLGAVNHILFHAVSHPSEGYMELCFHDSVQRTDLGNVNKGEPFSQFYVYSATSNILIRNLVISSNRLEYLGDG